MVGRGEKVVPLVTFSENNKKAELKIKVGPSLTDFLLLF